MLIFNIKNSHSIQIFCIVSITVSILIIALICFLTFRDGNATYQDSVGVTRFIAGLLYKDELSEAAFYSLHTKIRYYAHIVLFALLGFTAGLWGWPIRSRTAGLAVTILAFIVCMTLSFATEWFKQYIPGRHYDPEEVVLNAVSAFIGLSICYIIRYFSTR